MQILRHLLKVSVCVHICMRGHPGVRHCPWWGEIQPVNCLASGTTVRKLQYNTFWPNRIKISTALWYKCHSSMQTTVHLFKACLNKLMLVKSCLCSSFFVDENITWNNFILLVIPESLCPVINANQRVLRKGERVLFISKPLWYGTSGRLWRLLQDRLAPQIVRHGATTTPNIQLATDSCLNHLLLPGNGDVSRGKLIEKLLIHVFQVNPFHSGECTYIIKVLGIHSFRIRDKWRWQNPYENTGDNLVWKHLWTKKKKNFNPSTSAKWLHYSVKEAVCEF